MTSPETCHVLPGPPSLPLAGHGRLGSWLLLLSHVISLPFLLLSVPSIALSQETRWQASGFEECELKADSIKESGSFQWKLRPQMLLETATQVALSACVSWITDRWPQSTLEVSL